MEVKKQKSSSAGRVFLLDELRGFAIICMVIYHALYMLNYEFGVKIPFFFNSAFDIVRDIFAGMFVVISGIMCRYSHDNVRRGAKCFLLGMVITFTVPFFSDGEVSFGILHLLGISMMIYGLFERVFERIPAILGLALNIVLAVFTWNAEYGFLGIGGFRWNIPSAEHGMNVLFPLGIITSGYASSDYFPIMPWFFIFIAGSFLGAWFKNGSMPRMFYNSHCKWLAAAGRVTIWIYILHIPLIFGIFSLIFR